MILNICYQLVPFGLVFTDVLFKSPSCIALTLYPFGGTDEGPGSNVESDCDVFC